MLFEQISKDIVQAMKAKDKVRLMALRNAKKYFLEALTAPGADAELSDEQALKILSKLVKQGKDTAQLYVEQNRPDLAEEEMGQVTALEAYLPKALTPIQNLKTQHLGSKNPRLHTDEVLIALSICAATDSRAEQAMEQLVKLRGAEVHSSVILSAVDEKTFKRLGVNITCEPRYKS